MTIMNIPAKMTIICFDKYSENNARRSVCPTTRSVRSLTQICPTVFPSSLSSWEVNIMKNKSSGSSWINYVFLTVLYFFLPRVQLTMDSHLWTLIFQIRKISVSIITVCLLVSIYQMKRSHKWKRPLLKHLFIATYLLYCAMNFFLLLLIEFS